MRIEKIIDGNIVLAMVVRAKDWISGLNFISDKDDFQQVGFWQYSKGKKLEPHIHSKFDRTISRTQEVLIIQNGSIIANIFSENGELKRSIQLSKGDLIVLLHGGHGYEIMEDNTRVIEVKNGPYSGPEKDRRRLFYE